MVLLQFVCELMEFEWNLIVSALVDIRISVDISGKTGPLRNK